MHFALSISGAQSKTVGAIPGFLDTATLGSYFKLDRGEWVNGRTVLPCSAEPLAHALGGFGAPRTMYGPNTSRITRSDGSMWMPVKRPGTTPDSTPKAGERRCRTASPFLTMGLPM